MSVASGKRISSNDLLALANAANAATWLTRNVSPIYNDGGGNTWGHREISALQVNDGGNSYVPGDVVSLDYGTSFLVEAVAAGGKVIGLRIINAGAGAYADPATFTAQSASGGTGSGLTLDATFGQVGPWANYSFGNITNPSAGTIYNFAVLNGGTGYTVGNVLTLTLTLPGWTLTVNTVDGSGKILTITLNPGAQPTSIPANIASFSHGGGSGTGALFAGLFNLQTLPLWLTELNRLRSDIAANIGNRITAAQQYCSFSQDATQDAGGNWLPGVGWPRSGYTGAAGFDKNAQDQEFYFADTGNAETITLSASVAMPSPIGPYWQNGNQYDYSSQNVVVVDPSAGTYSGQIIDSIEYRFRIKNPTGAVTSGTLSFPAHAFRNPADGSGPVPLAGSLLVTSNIGSFAPHYDVYGQLDSYQCTFSSKPDGDYYVRVSGGTLTAYFVNAYPVFGWDVSYCVIGAYPITNTSYTHHWPLPMLTLSGSVSSTVWTAQATNGIHNTKAIYKIKLPALDRSPATGVGVTAIVRQPVWNAGEFPDNPGNGYQPTIYVGPSFTTSLTISNGTQGFWVGSTLMVADILAVAPGNMPWNLSRTKYGSSVSVQVNPALVGDQATNSPANTARVSNSYDNSLPVESQSEPPAWIAARVFTLGFVIIDSNGNLQKVTTAGTSSGSAPTWALVAGNTTTDGSVVWTCIYQVAAVTLSIWHSASVMGVGNTIHDSNGNAQMVVTAGTTGGAPPTWATTPGKQTKDGTVVWKMLTGLAQSKHRLQATPRYPFYKDGEATAWLKPPTSISGLTVWGAWNQWQPNTYQLGSYDLGWQVRTPAGGGGIPPADTRGMAFGWWIYCVSLNRQSFVVKQLPAATPGGTPIGMGDTDTGMGYTDIGMGGAAATPGSSSGGEIPVTIGCMRSGAFVAFGTWLTGQTINVLWPIFTSDALVYQCSERIDLQAVAIASGGSGVSTGTTCDGIPMAAAYAADPRKLIDLMAH